jgi:two-component system chemotaxis response regulator CheB
VRQLLEHVVGSDPRFEVVAAVASAEDALTALERTSPAVISLDIRLPGMDGFEATRRIMQQKPTPIVVCSASVEAADLQITMNALRAGALAVVEKPVGTTRADYQRLAGTLCTQLAIMSEVKVVRQRPIGTPRTPIVTQGPTSVPSTGRGTDPSPSLTATLSSPYEVIGIAASTGGPNAIVQVLNGLGRLPLPVLLVQHIMPSFLAGFAAWLGSVTPWRVVIAESPQTPIPGTVYLAAADHHLELDGARVIVTQTAPIAAQRPSATQLFRSLARAAGPSAVGVLLTGMGNDGAEGLLDLHRAGGYTIAEHESTAVVYGMPRAAVESGAARESLPLDAIGPRLLRVMIRPEEVR